MPRYKLNDTDADALVSYLRQLGVGATPGVSADTIELATIMSEDAPRAARESVLAVLERYVAVKNSQSRRESERAAAALRHPLGERRDRAFRRWHVSVWSLAGPASTWGEQLQRRYAAQPPFAILSGTTGHDWEVVHEFCERVQLPCILPVTDVPGNATDFYSLYYTQGAALEGRITAQAIKARGADHGRVLVLHGDDERSVAALERFRATMSKDISSGVVERQLTRSHTLDAREWRTLLEETRPDVLVAWTDVANLSALASLPPAAAPAPQHIYTMESVTPWREVGAIRELRGRVHHVYPYQVPAAGRSQFPREQAWLRSQQLDTLDPLVAAQALFACHVLGEGLVAIESNFSRDFLLEQFEHMLDRTAMTSLFPVTHLGPGQRILSNGAYVARIVVQGSVTLVPEAWIAF